MKKAVILSMLLAVLLVLVACKPPKAPLPSATETGTPTTAQTTPPTTPSDSQSPPPESGGADPEPPQDDTHNILIFGDSYSTFEGYVPSGYPAYYSPTRDQTNVRRVEETWWHLLCAEADMTMVRNESWSGSTICHTGYDGADCSRTSSFIYRLERLAASGFFEENRIDTVFVFGGTNDAWANVPMGKEKYEGQTEQDLFSFRPATCYFIGRLRELMPNANVVVLINTGLTSSVSSTLRIVAEHYGATVVQLENIDKQSGHPSILGMIQIKDQILACLQKSE